MLVTIFNILGLSQCLFLILFFIVEQRQRRTVFVLLAIMMLVWASIFTTNVLVSADNALSLPWLLFQSVLQFAIAPLIYFLACVLTQPEFKIRRAHVWHLLVVVLLAIPVEKWLYVAAWNLHSLIYQIAIFRVIRTVNQDTTPVASQVWIKYIAYGYSAIWLVINLMTLSSLFLEDSRSLMWNSISCLLVVHVYVISFLVMKFPLARRQVSEAVKAFRRSRIDDEEIERFKQLLEHGMRELTWYRNPQLTLPMLAEQMAIPSHHLSSLINHVYQRNFSQFVMQFRLEHVKKSLLDESLNWMTIDAHAAEAGFKSPASFYRVFKQQTGMTPTQYREQDLESSANARFAVTQP